MKKGTIAVIEISDSHVKYLQAKILRETKSKEPLTKVRSGRVVTHCEVEEIRNLSDEDISKILIDFKTLRDVRSENLIAVIPRRYVILKHITLPSVDDNEIQRMLGLQVTNQVPYAQDDIVYDYLILNKDPNGYTKLLLFILHKDVVERYLSIFNNAGYNPGKLVVSSLGLLHWYYCQVGVTKVTEIEPVAILNIDQVSSEICFCGDNGLVFSRNINFGARDLSEDKIERFMDQIELTVGTYNKETMGPELRKIVVISTKQEAGAIKEELEKRYDIPVDCVTPVDNLPCQKELDLSSLWGDAGFSVAAGLGLLFSNVRKLLNFIPKEVHHTKSTKIKKRQLVKFGLLFLVTLILGLMTIGAEIYRNVLYLKQLKEKNETVKSEVAKSEQKIQLINFIRDNIQNRTYVPDLIHELYDLTPPDISFRSFAVDESGLLTIQGVSKIGVSVNSFQSSLVDSAMFQDVTLLYANRIKIFNEQLTDFKITCQLSRRGKK